MASLGFKVQILGVTSWCWRSTVDSYKRDYHPHTRFVCASSWFFNKI